MKQTASRGVRDGLKYVNETYGFMLERGYEIVSADDAFVGWQVVLRKADLFVKIERSRGDEYISFRTGTQPPGEFIDLESVVNAATGEIIPLSFNSHVQELQKYLDRIETFFEGEYAKNPEGLRAAQQRYLETRPKAEVVPPKEPKRIAILYYPLMAIVILLLFGALTTLYMVLLDRMFSAFSLEADSYAIFMGVGAVLLAIGTMLLIRRWVKMVGSEK